MLGRSWRSGLLAEDNAKIDTEQMIIAAITDIEGPQRAMLELLVAWWPGRKSEPLISGPLDLPMSPTREPCNGNWHVLGRVAPPLIAHARPNFSPLAPSLLGTLQRHGLAVRTTRQEMQLRKYAQVVREAP